MLNFSRLLNTYDPSEVCQTQSHYEFCKKTNGQAARLPKEMTPELAYFIGFFLGDGGLKDTRRTLEFHGRREYKIVVGDYSIEFTEKIQQMFRQLFGITPPIRFERAAKGSHYYYVNPTSKSIFLFLTQVVGLGEGKHEKFVPKIILDSPLEIQQWFLRGYFDAEGSIYKKYNRPSWVISVHAKDHRLLEQVQAMMGPAFGLKESRLYREKCASKLFVTRKIEVANLVEKRLFTHPDKLLFPLPL